MSAYKTTKFPERCRKVMAKWAAHCLSVKVTKRGG